MPDIKGISFFPSASSVEADSLVLVSTKNTQATSGYDTEKTTAADLGLAIVNDFEYTQELDTASKKVAGAINELKAGMIGHYSTGDIKFSNLTWSQSASGKYYTSIDLDNSIPSGKTIIGITIEGWNNLRANDVMIPYIRTSRSIGIMSNVNTFADQNSAYGFSILYV